MASSAGLEQVILSWIAADLGINVVKLSGVPKVHEALALAIPGDWGNLEDINEAEWTEQLQIVFDAVYLAWTTHQGTKDAEAPEVRVLGTQTVSATLEDPSSLDSWPGLRSRAVFLVPGAVASHFDPFTMNASVEIIPLPEGFDCRSSSVPSSSPNLERPLPKEGDILDGKYLLRRQLGGGGFGIVFEADDLSVDHRVAVKFLDTGRSTSPLALEQFRSEARLVAKLNHPNIVDWKVFAQNQNGPDYFVMEYVDGEDLKQVLRREEKLTHKRTARLILQVLDALRTAHRLSDTDSVLHLDLKPSNIFITTSPRGEEIVKVIDFGIGQFIGGAEFADIEKIHEVSESQPSEDDNTTLRRSIASTDGSRSKSRHSGSSLQVSRACTPEYASPEQCAHMLGIEPLRSLDGRSDLYSLGVVAFQMLSGRLPFDRPRRRKDWLKRHLNDEPLRIQDVEPTVPKGLAKFVDRCLTRNREERFQSSDDAYHELNKFLEPNRWRLGLGVASLLVLIATVFIIIEKDKVDIQTRTNTYLTDSIALKRFLEDTESKWPILPSTIPKYESWLEKASKFLSAEPIHRRLLESPRESTAIDQEKLFQLIDGYEILRNRKAQVEANLKEARRVDEELKRYADRWEAALADISESEIYEGLELAPQEGLVPLRVDQITGLWDFWHPQSGEEPIFQDSLNRWDVTPTSGFVFVLIPEGYFVMGSQEIDPGDSNYDVHSEETETPIHEVHEPAFFISRFEITRGQWKHLTGKEPSIPRSTEPASYAYPVNQTSWQECHDVLVRLGLTLPTESQWERAARANTTSMWWTGDISEELKDFANLSDRDILKKLPRTKPELYEPWSDGWASPSPVDHFPPNPFGLHDVHGNVGEWCLNDEYDYDSGEVITPAQKVYRGGTFMSLADIARSANRERRFPQFINEQIGCRPARLIRK